MDVERYLKRDDRLMLVVGACEQHAYLSLLTDVKAPMAMAEAAGRATGVLVAPPLCFGISPHFAAYPGTISLRSQTFFSVVEDMVHAVYAQGFRRLLFVNGHGGNDGVRQVLREIVNATPDLQIAWHSWWESPAVDALMEEAGLRGYHASWMEAFSFCRLSDLPEGEKPPVPRTARIGSAKDARVILGDGSYGGRYQADDALMQRLFDACVADIVEILKFV
jgi:creatinine amidohydrolase